MNNLNIFAEENTNLSEPDNQYWRDLYEALKRLHENPDFQKVILDAYFRDKAVDGVSMLAHDLVVRNGKRGEMFESLVAISHLMDFFLVIKNLGAPIEDEEDEAAED